MYAETLLEEYRSEIRGRVCTHCLHRPSGGPPCAALGRRCRIEVDLPRLIDTVHHVRSESTLPYIDDFHDHVCMHCANGDCPCPLQFLLGPVVQAIDAVDQRRAKHAVQVAAAS